MPTPEKLPPSAVTGLGTRPFGVYVHVPFCASRCGYCDFNTYTPHELGERGQPRAAAAPGQLPPAAARGWLDGIRAELDLAAATLKAAPAAGTLKAAPAAGTLFVGGGTPSLLGADGLAAVLDAVRATVGLTAGAEVSTEANPESTSPEFFTGIAAAGFTRVSLGMQSAAEHVLARLDRQHTPGRAVAAAREAHAAGIEHVNLDLIYGTPGEHRDDLAASLDAALRVGVDHVSAYGLVVEPGTALARRVGRGELSAPDDEVLAERYEQVDDTLTAAGFGWYEVCNWARGRRARCRHNLGYWSGGDWWGVGPGAHSHIGGVRWWNVAHPARYAATLRRGDSPVAEHEVLTAEQRHTERVLLELRRSEGLAVDALDGPGRAAAQRARRDGLLASGPPDRLVLTRRGRLLADAVVRDLLAG